MFIPATAGRTEVDLSPFGEWTWSMMGLAGRDPVFYAQLESELALHPTRAEEVQSVCFRCHGVMGQRQLGIDRPGAGFRKEMVYRTAPHPDARYGALARDGVSCTVCHQIVDDGRPLDEVFTGLFTLSRPGAREPGVSEIHGPFESPVTLPMLAALGMKPVPSAFVKSSRLCASCHTIRLPVFDRTGRKVGEDFEQSTYLEWLNSAYRDELGRGATPKACQDCHMPDRHEGRRLAFRIANVQDRTYPEADHRAPLADLTLPIREGFRRHTLLGINQFVLHMFDQFDRLLGIRKTDYMSGSERGLPNAIAESNRLAREETARVEIARVEAGEEALAVDVVVTNLTGHRFPSGVGFRRAFLELSVLDAHNAVRWASGRTDSLGILVDGAGRPLRSEFFEPDPRTGEPSYQPHHRTITREDQAQVYEELTKSPEGTFTTSFLARADTVKDNRLLPLGWTRAGPPGFHPEWAEATAPRGDAAADPRFVAGSHTVTYRVGLPRSVVQGGSVVARLYYQSVPPYYLKDRFATAQGPEGQRLHYIASRLNVKGTAIESWKLLVQSATARLAAPPR
jgi:hypothetical protein